MIYIFDLLGIHCGMHYYDLAFSELLKDYGKESVILSNFNMKGRAKSFFPLFFKGRKIKGFVGFAYSYLKFPLFLLNHRNDKIVYLTFGEIYELPFLISLILSNKAFVDVHEVHALRYKDNSIISKIFEWMYCYVIKNVIYHSDRTKSILSHANLKMLYVPHFKYIFKKEYNEAFLSDDVRMTFVDNTHNRYLFFGNLSIVKGIDTIVNVFNNIDNNEDFELVIAGKNVEGLDFSSVRSDKVRVLDRHINDDELVYLYSRTDYVLLPYKKSSQSGIFAMSAYFRKPMVLSDIPYFRQMINEFPSFGIISSLEKYKDCVLSTMRKSNIHYFSKEDCDKFENKKVYETFVKKFDEV